VLVVSQVEATIQPFNYVTVL